MSVNSFSGQPAIPASYGTSAGKNAVINGGFDIWQRGTSVSISSTYLYTADRWQAGRSGAISGLTVSRQSTNDTTNLPNIQYCARVQRDSGVTTTGTSNFYQPVETLNAVPFAGKTVTLSFYARAGANYSATSNELKVFLVTGTGTDQNGITSAYTGAVNAINNQNATLTTTWQRFSYSATLASNVTEFYVGFNSTPTGTAGAADYYEITGVQLELGATATTFARNASTIQGELAACQRYYEVLTAADINGICYTTANAYVTAPFKVTKRTDAITITYAASNTNLLYAVGSGYKSPTAVATETYDANALGFTATGFSTTSMAIGYPLRYTGSNIGISAEL